MGFPALDAPTPTLAPPVAPTELPLVGFDIETDTTHGGLDPETSSVVAAAIAPHVAPARLAGSTPEQRALPTADTACEGAGFLEPEVFLGDEADLLERVDQRIAALGPAILVTWNGARFDLPFVAHRAAVLGIELGLRLGGDAGSGEHGGPARWRWHQMVHLDGYRLYRGDVGRTFGLSCALKSLARLTGIRAVELDRSRLHTFSEAEVTEYVASDARVAVELVLRRLPTALWAADWAAMRRQPGFGPPETLWQSGFTRTARD